MSALCVGHLPGAFQPVRASVSETDSRAWRGWQGTCRAGFWASRVFGKALKLLFGADVQSERFEGVKKLAADSGSSARLYLPFSLIVCWNGGRLCFSR